MLKIKEILNDGSKLISYKSYRFNEECKLFDTTIIENLMYHDLYLVDMLINDIDFSLKDSIIEHTPFEYCDLKAGPINLVSSYRDKKTRVIDIKTENNTIHWDETSGVLKHGDNIINIDSKVDNINHKFNDIYKHIKNNTDDDSKDISLKILKLIDNDL